MERILAVVVFVILCSGTEVASQPQPFETRHHDTTDVDALFQEAFRYEETAQKTMDKKQSLSLLDTAILIRKGIIETGVSKELALQYQVETFERYAKLLHDTRAPKMAIKGHYLRTTSTLQAWIALDHTIDKTQKLAAIYESLAGLEEGTEESLIHMNAAADLLESVVKQMPKDKLLAERLSKCYELSIWKSLRLNMPKEAKGLSLRAIEFDSGHMRAHSLLAASYLLLKKTTKAEKIILENLYMTDADGNSFAKIMLRDLNFLEQKGLFPDNLRNNLVDIKSILEEEPR
ncbi:MAG: hypothetical protein AAF502_03435 [Bacteroidota bacterium]